jgi:hypothetical protein
VRELLLGAVRTQDLVKAKQIRCVRFPLELVAAPREPHADKRRARIARLADTGRGRHVFPLTAKVGEYVFKTVKGVLDSVLGFEAACRYMANPSINRV